ncbi:16S rRNA (uracil(1498)-N(3))-methyltransferase [Desulfobulbus alkaliphilus]|uniref:16S rRNA (uracil(1498)-N(3))-methyltransferase n=1 Tax=Desulfobulbus alkaliphilus TaxID=869814 RepID=UPI001965DB51|nr:16S rRNA (uracil(1498)-N(3))-methyltransferase [Desulfobulbus alkaliphilus]MBM9537951.1 16S rRNA (uracil(1498)-N(3))-methyltransferase [Desulfobulbus alkaliphilus]
MNLLLFDPLELTGDETILTGRRAEHLIRVLRVEPGDWVRVGVINGQLGSGRVLAVEGASVRLAVVLDREPGCDLDVDLILALPRPIMLQRILKQATVLGVRRFHLIRSRRVEKSFFQTPLLAADKMRAILVDGMEQAMDTRMPEVSIHPRFKPFVEDVLPGLDGHGLIAHPQADGTLADVAVAGLPGQRLLLAVGPEGGWSDYELQCFAERGFLTFTMGRRILHVDTAVVSVLAQLQLLYDLRNR